MPKVGRITDIGVGVCCCHNGCVGMSGIIITGSSDIITDNLKTARIGDIVLGNCGHTGVLITGSSTVIDDSRKEIRVGDQFVGCFTGNIITGSPTTSSDG